MSEEESLRDLHLQRLQTLGLLAGGIAHDFNNILTGIMGHITYLKAILPQSGPHAQSLVAIEDGSKKASALIQRILSFSKMEASEKLTVVDLNSLVLSSANLLRGAISPEYTIFTDVPNETVAVLGVEAHLSQILINLVINARDAISGQGEIRIILEPCNDKSRLKAAYADRELAHPEYLRLAVSDNGHGIPEELHSKIFEPYFSTKNSKGTGLGLSIVREIVALYGGGIQLESKIDHGTTLSIYFPRHAEPTKVAKKEREQLVGGTESILIVDDEAPVRNVISLSLKHLGYQVTAVASGKEALDCFAEKGVAFDLVIMDMLMPNISGEELFFKIRNIHPDINVLLISGFTSEESIKRVMEGGGRGFIQKPFTIDDLARKVRDCLAR